MTWIMRAACLMGLAMCAWVFISYAVWCGQRRLEEARIRRQLWG